MDPVEYVERKSGRIQTEKIYGSWALSLLYGESIPARLFALFFLPILARISWFSKLYGYLQKRPKSAGKIDRFIREFQIDETEFLERKFHSFNDFFIRKLKPEARPIDPDPKQATLPADGRYLVFPDLSKADRFYVKGQQFDLVSFLQNSVLARRFSEGSMMIARLCPTDYHRFHFPCDGIPEPASLIEGPLFSVNPIALRKRLSILTENRRMMTEIETDHFGTILYVEVGATCVGSIHQTYRPGSRVKKGEEKGYFSFGGSSLVLLFEKGKIHFDDDLILNSQKGLETKGLFGTSFGTAD